MNEIAEVYIRKTALEKENYKKEFKDRVAFTSEGTPHYYFEIGDVATFEDKLKENTKKPSRTGTHRAGICHPQKCVGRSAFLDIPFPAHYWLLGCW
jgi:hypothetical protein